MHKVLISTVPFGAINRLPLELLEQANIDYLVNPLGRKLTEDELAEMIVDFDALIAGTEPITKRVLAKARKLKHISRVGIGLDGLNLNAAREKGITVSYTPDAPAPAVSELTVGLMLTLLRSLHVANNNMHNGIWRREFGRRLSGITVGVIGLGRIGSRVIKHLNGFQGVRILVNDSRVDDGSTDQEIEFVSKDVIYKTSDIITIHIPLTPQTKNMIRTDQLLSMKSDAFIINTSRGGIINEKDLAYVLSSGHLSGAAIDVFEQEPYSGELIEIENCFLTSHMGSMSLDCRSQMEIEATENIIRFFQNIPIKNIVPQLEYEMQKKD